MAKRLPNETFFIVTNKVRNRLLECKLTAAEWRMWFYLVTLDPFGDSGAKFSPAELMLKCGIKKTAYFKAKAKFQKLGLFDFKDGVTKVINLQGQFSQSANAESQSANAESQSANAESQSANAESQSPKRPSDKGSESSQTIQTYTDFIKTLSDSERERFFEFVEEKTKNFPHPIMDLEAWLAKPNSAGRNRWDIYYQRFVKATTPPSPPKQNRPLRDEIERQRLEAMEHYRKEAELKAAQGIEENPDPEDNRDILQIEERKGAKKDEMKSKINVECSRDIKTENRRSFKDHPLIHDEVNTPTKPERSYRKE